MAENRCLQTSTVNGSSVNDTTRTPDGDWNTYVVSLPLEPVERLFRTVSAVPGCGVHNTPLRVCAASPRYLRRR